MAANKGYFQVLPNSPGDYKVAGNVTIAGGAGLATFAAAQTSVYMGVGSRVEYNGGATVGYVASKVDQSNWYLVDANGAAMGNLGATAVVSITADFASLAAAEAGYAALTGNANITAAGANQDVCFVGYCNQTTYDRDATQCFFSGPTCDSTHEFFVYCITNLATEGNFVHANVDSGRWDEEKYRLEYHLNNSRIEISNTNIMFVHFNHVQIWHAWAGGRCIEMYAPTGSGLFVEQSILRIRDSGGPSTGQVITGGINAGNLIVLRNNVFYSTLHDTATTGSFFYPFYTIQNGTYIITGNVMHNFDDIVAGTGMFLLNNFLDLASSSMVATDYHDYNIYRQSDLDEPHGKLTTQTDAELFSSGTGSEETYVWYPLTGSNLIGAGIKLRDEDSADMNHEQGYRLVLETNPIDNYTEGDSWLPTDFLNPRGRWDVGALAYYPQDFVAYGICPNSPGDFKVASQISMLDGIMHCVNNQNHALMGIGAEVDYDTTETAYIVGKLAENEWMVVTGTGAKPADTNNVTLDSIDHPFASQVTFETGIAGILGTADLTTAEMSVHGVCYCQQVAFTADTATVTYDGTTCDETYFLKIYTIWNTVTQGNFAHRVTAGGVWDVQKYRFETGAVTPSWQTGNTVRQIIWMQGIQNYNTSNAAAVRQFIYISGETDSKVIIDSCVFRMTDVNANWLRTAVRVDQGLATVSNSIAYLDGANPIQGDFKCFQADGADSSLDVIACTIYGWEVPITISAGAIGDAYNNAIIGNTAVCVNLTNQDYNVYDVNEGETHGFLTVQADAALFAAVAGGRETWNWNPLLASNLINRAQHFNLYTNDLDNEAGWRYQSIAPDAGALERTQVVCPFGVCPNGPADFQTGNGLVTVLNGIGSFDVPQSNVLMGVGAEIDYGGGPAIAYVKEMINPFQFILVTGAGAAAPNAADQAINSISHPFASQSAAEAGFAALTGNLSLVIGDYQLYLPCYAEQATYTADAVAVDYDGPLCDFGHWIKLFQTFSTVKESNMQHRVTNGGVWDATRYRIEVANNPVIDISNTVILMLMTGMQIHLTLNNASNAVLVRGGANSITLICGCVTVSNGTNQVRRGIASEAPAAKEIIIINNVITMTGAGVTQNNQHGISCSNSKIDIWAYQNTIDLFRDSINVGANVTCIAKNNAFVDNGLANTGVDTSDYNLYREFDEGDANGILTVQNNSALFEAYDVGTAEDSDWSPAAGSDLIGKGITGPGELVNFAFYLEGDLDHPFETEWRPQIGGYAIGALEKFAGSGYIPQWYTYW